ncbi:primase alpha helix C-terminal domain-containing protein [Thermoclostridium stercorarium]|jgi:putative DNA primase/helicase|uniref:Primase C-terminal 1 domain-containing protein n=1 Tax=Thermoclostridium stercorarium subsp. leptospartum DSM 9219 TaxID=1346611 RepID=A0A1B1YN30_THEST|nr:primase alpha helix C-terminal domain-containing protein [Thermoclostridium stercorarium]ANX02187.1 hypothetical protein CSTERLE_11710 [Thermoclostridium stercorarium subsp. leptospartum DSM 9219]UZQ85259.1 primase alpha helix C-terminal domain-containing protein [Thermoclostridium stercorarium]
MAEEGIYAALLAENNARCNPPLDEEEVRKIAHSVSRYQSNLPVKKHYHGNTIEANMKRIIDVLKESDALRFCNNPMEFIQHLESAN